MQEYLSPQNYSICSGEIFPVRAELYHLQWENLPQGYNTWIGETLILRDEILALRNPSPLEL